MGYSRPERCGAEPRQRPLETPGRSRPPARSRRTRPTTSAVGASPVPGCAGDAVRMLPLSRLRRRQLRWGLGLFQWWASLQVGSAPLPQPLLPPGAQCCGPRDRCLGGGALTPAPLPQLRRPAPSGLGGRVWGRAERGEYSHSFCRQSLFTALLLARASHNS